MWIGLILGGLLGFVIGYGLGRVRAERAEEEEEG